MDTTKLRILSLGNHSDPTNTESEISRAFERLGHEVIRLNEAETSRAQLAAACKETAPDLLLGAKFRFAETRGEFDGQAGKIIVDALSECRPHVGQIAVWVFDALLPRFSPERWQWAETIAPAVDVFACTDGSAAVSLPNGCWLPQGATDMADDNADWPTDYEGDALFVGLAYRERSELVDAIRRRLGSRFRVVPNYQDGEQEVRGAALTTLVRSYRICVCPPTPTWPGYWSNRAITLSRHGALLAMAPVQGMERDGWRASTNYLAMPTTAEGYADKLVEILERCDRGQLGAIRRAGYELARSIPYDRRCGELLNVLAGAKARIELKRSPVTEVATLTVDGTYFDDGPTDLKAGDLG